MNNENSNLNDTGIKNKIARIVGNRKVQMGVAVVTTAAATAVLTRKLTLKQAFTFPQMTEILKDEELTQSLIDAANAKAE